MPADPPARPAGPREDSADIAEARRNAANLTAILLAAASGVVIGLLVATALHGAMLADIERRVWEAGE